MTLKIDWCSVKLHQFLHRKHPIQNILTQYWFQDRPSCKIMNFKTENLLSTIWLISQDLPRNPETLHRGVLIFWIRYPRLLLLFWNPEIHIFDLLLSSVITPDFKYPGINSSTNYHRNPDQGRLDLLNSLYKSHQITKNLLLLKSWYPGMNCL